MPDKTSDTTSNILEYYIKRSESPENRSKRRETIFNRSHIIDTSKGIEETSEEQTSSDDEYVAFSTELQTKTSELSYRTAKTDMSIPKNYKDMLQNNEKENWLNAINIEMNNMISMGVWDEGDLVKDLPPGERAIDTTWVFAKKDEQDSKIQKFKGRGFRKFMELTMKKFLPRQ
jgi:hypothetical protein